MQKRRVTDQYLISFFLANKSDLFRLRIVEGELIISRLWKAWPEILTELHKRLKDFEKIREILQLQEKDCSYKNYDMLIDS